MITRDLDEPSARSVTIISRHHCWRTLGGMHTGSVIEAKGAMNDGCTLQSAEFVLRYPESMLCDLSNIDGPLRWLAPQVIDEAFRRIGETCENELRSRHWPGVFRIRGDDLRPEIAVSAPNKQCLSEFRTAVLARAFHGLDLEPVDHPSDPRGLRRSMPLVRAADRTLVAHNEVIRFYSAFLNPDQFSSGGGFCPQHIYEPHRVWHEISRIAHNKLFVLAAGFALGLGYMDCVSDKAVYFTEVHRQNDSSALERRREFSDLFPSPGDGVQASWVVIDKAYSGGSLEYGRSLLRRKFGPSVDVKTVALFPKSLAAVAAADFIVYAGRLIRVRDVIGELDPVQWHRQLLYFDR